MEIKGRDLLNGVPKEITITQRHIAEALAERSAPLSKREGCSRSDTARMAADIVDKGIVLTAAWFRC